MKKLRYSILLALLSLSAFAQDWNYEVDYVLKNAKGTIKILEDGQTAVIVPDNNPNGRYISTQLPEEYKKEGLKVTFCGDVGKIPPNFRMIGTPLKLKCVCITRDEQQKFKLKRRKYVFK